MCAIAGAFPYKKFNIEVLQNALYHRGIDEQTRLFSKDIALLHNRLAIQDIANGSQPLQKDDCIIVFNGEIYNHLELRKNYLQGFSFSSTSDTETLLCMYKKFKNNMFQYLDGMFAFAIYDKKKNIVFFARDRAGKKPLYLYKKGKDFIFASELGAIQETLKELKISSNSVESFIRNGFLYGSSTPYEDVIELEASCYYVLDIQQQKLTKEQYFSLLDYYKQPKEYNYGIAKKSVEEILQRSIKSRLLSSDVEVGAFLSGGIDSSLIVAMASQYTKKLKTFTVKFDNGFDESFLAKQTAQRYKTDHHELTISMDLKNDIEKILQSYGEPFMDSSAIASYYVSKEARKYVKVVLNGDGADEIFGGYRRYVAQTHPLLNSLKHITPLTSFLPKPHKKHSYYTYFYRLLTFLGKNGLSKYNSAVNDIFEDYYQFSLENSIFQKMEEFILEVEQDRSLTSLDKALYLDSMLLLRSDLLKKMDIASMQFSLETRSPFLSQEMLMYVPTLADDFKIRGIKTKYILRDIARKYLDENILEQPKRGFEVPLQFWVDNELHDVIFDYLNNQSYVNNFVKWEFIEKLLYKKVAISDVKRAKILWTLFAVEVWKKGL